MMKAGVYVNENVCKHTQQSTERAATYSRFVFASCRALRLTLVVFSLLYKLN